MFQTPFLLAGIPDAAPASLRPCPRCRDGRYWSTAYHDFAVLWEPGMLTWFVDGKEFSRTSQHVPSTAAYLVLDNEVGLGDTGPRGPNGSWAGDPSGTPFPQVMMVDHVRVWAKKSQTSRIVP